MRSTRRWHVVGVMAAAAFLTASRQGSAVPITASWYLDQSNVFADGINYARVDILADADLGTVTFTVDVFDVEPTYGGLGDDFGIQSFGFSFEHLTSTPSEWMLSLPDRWSLGSGTMSGFGVFLVESSGTGNSRQDPLEFTITLPTPSEAVCSNFAVMSSVHAGEGNVYFAAHVGGFNNDYGSHFVGGSLPVLVSTPVPEPTTGVLGAVALALSTLRRRVVPR